MSAVDKSALAMTAAASDIAAPTTMQKTAASPELSPTKANAHLLPTRLLLERSYSEISIERMDREDKEKTDDSFRDNEEEVQEEEEEDEEEEEENDQVKNVPLLAEKIRSMFGLPASERLLGEFPCYLVRLVTLPGWLYVTDHHVCFYASLPSRENGPQKAGYLSKKNHRASPRSYRYYFELRNYVLSWYESAENKYVPLDSIDLKETVDIRASRTRPFGFQIQGTHARWNMTADSKVSQKEWMDELRRAAFMAKNAGSSVRIVLPFNKMAKVNKTAAFGFAEYIRIQLMDAVEMEEYRDEYYFAFFPDIDAAYRTIERLWHSHQQQQSQFSLGERTDTSSKYSEDNSVDVSAFQNADDDNNNVYGNTTSSAAFSAMLVGLLSNPAALLRDNASNNNNNNSRRQGGNDIETSPSDSDDNSKSKRRSWMFSWVSSSSSPQSPVPDQPDQQSKYADTTKPATLVVREPDKRALLPPTPDIDIKEAPSTATTAQEPATTKRSERNKKHGRFRSASTASIMQFALQSLGFVQPSSSPTIVADSASSSAVSGSTEPNKLAVIPATVRHRRSGSFGGFIRQHTRKASSEAGTEQVGGALSPATSPSRPVRAPSWWIDKMTLDTLQPSTAVQTENQEEEEEQYRRLLNEQLHKTFPMLGDAETVIASFSAAIWRTLPYYGRLFMTRNYLCFHSKVLAGRQKLIIPFNDITRVRRLKSRGYYLLHGLGLIAEGTTEEIYFEFSSVDIRDRCYALVYLHLNNSNELEEDSGSGTDKPKSIKLSDILASSTEHVLPPLEYNGPPVLSSIPSIEHPLPYTPPSKPMHITCLTIGSRGDVQPYIALCKQLQRDGHRCRIASHGEYKSWVEAHGIEFRSIGGDPGELMKLCIENGFLSYSFIKKGTKFFYKWFETLLETAWEACQGTDLLIESPSAMVGIHVAEKLEIYYFRSMPFPWTRTTRFAHPFAMQNAYTRGLPLYNDMTYVLIDMALWTGTSKYINRFRRDKLHLPPTTLERLEEWRVPHIYSFSPSVLPPPKDWPDYVHCTGYWFLDNPEQSWQPDPAFTAFLEQGNNDPRPIIYIGFGSIIVPDPEEMSRVIVEAVVRAGVRAIICKGWSSRKTREAAAAAAKSAADEESSQILNRYPGTIYSISSVPHDWLFPRIQGVVHHGGAGTTAAGLRAGLPTVIKPFFGDQRFWGQRVEELGVGVCIHHLTVKTLTDALNQISHNHDMISKARALGATIRTEDGVKTAVECIYRDLHLAKRKKPAS